MASNVPLDSVVTSVIEAFKSRAAFGQKKYGTNLDRTDLSFLQWIQHSQEELMDAILYLEKIKKVASEKKVSEDELVDKMVNGYWC
jgi:hypothetical protein